MHILHLLQQTFQVILASDSRSTFSIVIYDDLDAIVNNIIPNNGLVGFAAGDQWRSSSVEMNNFVLKKVNVFRLDGTTFAIYYTCMDV